MSVKNISEKYLAPCSPVIDSNFDTCGALTLASIDHLSVTDLNSLFTLGGLYADLDAWFRHSFEMKACGTRTFAWYDWIMANSDRSSYREAYNNALRPGATVVKGPSLLHPWVMGRQESVVNRDHWKIEDGIDAAGYGAGAAGAQAIAEMSDGPLSSKADATAILRVTSRHGIPVDPKWFRAGEVLHVFTRQNGVVGVGSWKVVRAAVDDALTYIDVAVTSENGGSTQAFHDYTANTSETEGDGITGVMVPGINNVNDFESWCNNLPNVDPRKMVPFWYQTYRTSRCVDSEYLKVFKRLMVSNEAFKTFGDLEMSERNRQDELEMQKRFVHAFFFQKPISTNQTLTLWESLDDITSTDGSVISIGLGSKLQAKRANWVGVREQLHTCDRVKDLSGQPLNIAEFLQYNYDISRARKSNGRKVTRIEWHTNAYYRETIFRGMLEYYYALYGDKTRLNFEAGQKTELGFIFDVYKVPFPSGIEIAVISVEFFDDWYDEHNAAGQAEAGNMLLCLDIGKPGGQMGGTIYYGQLKTNRKIYTTAKIEELAKIDSTYRCTMEVPDIQQSLYSETGLVVVECPLHSLWIENISPQTPVVSGKTLPYTDLY